MVLERISSKLYEWKDEQARKSWQTHVRAWAAHVGYGVAVASTYKLAEKIAA